MKKRSVLFDTNKKPVNRVSKEAQNGHFAQHADSYVASSFKNKAVNDELPLTRLKERFNEVMDEFDLLRPGVFLLATNGEVICSNNAAVQILLKRAGLKVDMRNRLSCSNLVENLRLQRTIAKVVSGEDNRHKGSIEIEKCDHASSYLLRMLAVYQDQTPVGIITVVIDDEEGYEIDLADITALFELMSNEQRSEFSFDRQTSV
ncbi:hypothetical protein [uncultured Amphritea sp.]|uniref:hypothetical protein n=1 Tax=uncultured Amphritea sp. TaxID=981605 RepID=UPI0026244A1F|nr:hypothetical protein [uncultured Amphritea sp.]